MITNGRAAAHLARRTCTALASLALATVYSTQPTARAFERLRDLWRRTFRDYEPPRNHMRRTAATWRGSVQSPDRARTTRRDSSS